MAEPRAHVPHPRGHDARDASGAHQLVEEDVRDGADEGQVPASLADQLVTSGEGNGRLERGAHAHHAAIGNEAGHRFPHGHELGLGHPAILLRLGARWDRLGGDMVLVT
jgi:hypothetical protein